MQEQHEKNYWYDKYAPKHHSAEYWRSRYKPKAHSAQYYQSKYVNPKPKKKHWLELDSPDQIIILIALFIFLATHFK